MPIVRRAYLAAAPAWVALLALAPFAATRVHASALTHAFALAIYFVGSLVCHQKPERSFHAWGAQMPVCARCTGIYLGAAIGLGFAGRSRSGLERSRSNARMERGPVNERWALVLASVPTAATLLFEWATGATPSNAMRFAAGAPLGVVVSWLILRPLDSARGHVSDGSKVE